MAKKGVSIKELARELGLTSRQLIDRCRQAGIPAQNSITKLNVEAERRVRALVAADRGTGLPPAESASSG
jgi:hypothetical protein